jgi:hypothetical protein
MVTAASKAVKMAAAAMVFVLTKVRQAWDLANYVLLGINTAFVASAWLSRNQVLSRTRAIPEDVPRRVTT